MDQLECLGGLSRLEEVLVDYDVDTAVLAFARPDRTEFFGALDPCYEHGVTAEVHREHADSVLTCGFGGTEVVDVVLEPRDVQERFVKRAFDVVFATVGLLVLAPLMLVVAGAIKLEDGGSFCTVSSATRRSGIRLPCTSSGVWSPMPRPVSDHG